MSESYNASTPAGTLHNVSGTGHMNTPEVDVTTEVVTPTDRVRWGPIIAGLFTALSTLAVLSVLGVAVAGSAYDPGDRARTFGIGAGIWGGVSMLIPFAIGGWLAARSAAVRGHNNGLLNGAMVWAVAIPLMLYMLAGTAMRTAGTAMQTATGAAQAGVQAASQVGDKSSPDDTGDATLASARQSAEGTGQRVQDAVTSGSQQAKAAVQSPQNQERAADLTARTAWGTLVSLLLALAAAALGGYLGARRTDDVHARRPATA